MPLRAGIVGLPNVGKSTLFNAITKKNILAANYPFATIEPNVGMVTVPDERLDFLNELIEPKSLVPTTFEFTDIAGLVKGASHGEGLGNKFLSHIREVDAIVEVVRCFDDSNITHVEGDANPLRDTEIIDVEFIFCDLEVVDTRLGKIEKKAVSTKDKDALKEVELLKRIKEALENNIPARKLEYTEDDLKILKAFNLLTMKPIIYVANIKEDEIGKENSYVKDLKEAVIDKIPDADYTGGAVTPGVTVRYKGKVLKSGQDYTVSYKNNVNLGTAKVTVTALSSSEYCGMKETGFLIKVKTPTVTNVENTASGTNIKWGKVIGAEQYYIYRKAENGKWSKIATVGSSKDSYCDTSVHSGTRYSYSVAAYANGWTSPYDASGKTLRYLAQPALNSVENVSSGATIKWKKVKGAAGYRIYRKKGSSAWQYVAAVSGENTKTYTDKKVKSKNGETYFYTVCAYNGNDKGTYHRTGKKIIRLTAPALNNPVNKAAKKLEVKWKKNNKAAGYQVQYSTSKKFSGAKTLNIKSKNTTKKTISKLKKNKKYYIRIRSYKKSGKTTYYSNWSSKKSKKITK